MNRVKLSIVFVILFTSNLFSSGIKPFETGSYVVGGSCNYTHDYVRDTYTDYSYSLDEFNLNPYFSYFVRNNIALGVKLLYTYYSPGSHYYHDLGIGPVLTKYWGKDKQKIKPFMGLSVYYEEHNPFENTPSNIKRIGGTISGGLFYMLVDNVAITTELYYSRIGQYPYGSKNSYVHNLVGIQFGIAAFLK